MKFANFIICIFLSLSLQSNYANSQNVDNQRMLMKLHQDITRGNIELTKEVHQYYWELLEQAFPGNPEEVIEVFKRIRNDFGKDFQIETWISAKLTNENGKITKTQKFIKLESSFIHKMALEAGYEEGTKDYESYVAEKNTNKPLALLNANRIINAAINNSSFTLDDGSEMHITTETINSVIENFEQSEYIIKKLFNKDWSNK